MSSEQTFSTHDLRSNAQGFKRDAARKAKWQYGAVVQVTVRGVGHPRPSKASKTTYSINRRLNKSAVASLAHGAKVARKHDMLDGPGEVAEERSASSGSDSEIDCAPEVDVGVMYSFDASKGPTEGSQILNVALAKAVQKFEEKETVKLVKNEYEILDSEGESVRLSSAKGKGKAVVREAPVVVAGVDEDEDYEFV